MFVALDRAAMVFAGLPVPETATRSTVPDNAGDDVAGKPLRSTVHEPPSRPPTAGRPIRTDTADLPTRAPLSAVAADRPSVLT